MFESYVPIFSPNLVPTNFVYSACKLWHIIICLQIMACSSDHIGPVPGHYIPLQSSAAGNEEDEEAHGFWMGARHHNIGLPASSNRLFQVRLFDRINYKYFYLFIHLFIHLCICLCFVLSMYLFNF